MRRAFPAWFLETDGRRLISKKPLQIAGTETASRLSRLEDPETEVKRRAVFALSQLPKGEGVPLLIDVARKNSNPAVRKQAIFWLGQSKDPRAIEFFAEILK